MAHFKTVFYFPVSRNTILENVFVLQGKKFNFFTNIIEEFKFFLKNIAFRMR